MPEVLLPLLLIAPLLGAGLCITATSPKAALSFSCATVFASTLLGSFAISSAFQDSVLSSSFLWLRMDALTAIHVAVMDTVFVLSSLYSFVYFDRRSAAVGLPLGDARRFASLWCASLASMTLLLLSDNLGLMWVGMEATTLVTAFLISVHPTNESLEAMWKYVLICSIGVGFAFIGTLLFAAASEGIGLDTQHLLLWSELRERASELDPTFVKVGFIFVTVGYGTKAGLAPVHSWLPDAHSQAPAPVSALFSGFMLNAALYCIARYLPIVALATGAPSWGQHLLLGLGLFSILVAATFIPLQRDLKRLLAYSSVEHIGIMCVGLGIGGLATFAALFHMLNHAIGKSLAFFAAGRLGQDCGSYELDRMQGALSTSRLWGVGILLAVLALLGAAPFSLFMSEFQIVSAGFESGAWLTTASLLLGLGAAAVGLLAHLIPLVFSQRECGAPPMPARPLESLLVAAPLVVLLLLGVAMPDPLRNALEQASRVLQVGAVTLTAGVGAGPP